MNLLSLVDSHGIPPEVKLTSQYYRHPQYPSRCLIVELNEGKPYLRFSKVPAPFVTRWELDREGAWRKGEDPTPVIEDFFKLDVQVPPQGAPSFETVLEWCTPIALRLANRFKRDRHYELNDQDLFQYAVLKIRECWLDCGDKPREEFERIVSTSIWHRFESLLSKHYVTQSRRVEEIVSITDDNIDMMPGEWDTAFVDREETDALEEAMYGLNECEKDVVRQIRCPHPIILQCLRVDIARYNHLRHSGVKRLVQPRINLMLMVYFTSYTPAQIQAAITSLFKRYKIKP
jgi:hypothetical protein